jgi:hypothetical protein
MPGSWQTPPTDGSSLALPGGAPFSLPLPGHGKAETRAENHSFSPSRLFLIQMTAAATKEDPNQAAKVRFQALGNP